MDEPTKSRKLRTHTHTHTHKHTRARAHTCSPFDSPKAMGDRCVCINGSDFACASPVDNGRHGRPTPLPGVHGDCNLDIFFGGIWWQRIKQLLLSNGIAVLVVNPYYFDGWEAWDEASSRAAQNKVGGGKLLIPKSISLASLHVSRAHRGAPFV